MCWEWWDTPWMGQILSSLPPKPPKPRISHLCAGLAGSAGRGGVAPPRRVALWLGERCFSAGATVRDSTHSTYFRCPGWRWLQNKEGNRELCIKSFKLCIWQTWVGKGTGVESGWSGSADCCFHTGNSLNVGERFEVYSTEKDDFCLQERMGDPRTPTICLWPDNFFCTPSLHMLSDTSPLSNPWPAGLAGGVGVLPSKKEEKSLKDESKRWPQLQSSGCRVPKLERFLHTCSWYAPEICPSLALLSVCCDPWPLSLTI